jgi:hypothetical protein
MFSAALKIRIAVYMLWFKYVYKYSFIEQLLMKLFPQYTCIFVMQAY